MQANLLFEEELTPKRGTKIPVGIHTNCKVTSVDTTAEYVDINFEHPDGTHHNKRLWLPKGNYPRKVKNPDGSETMETVQEAVVRETRQNLSHLATVVNIFLTEDERTALKAGLAKTPEYQDVVEQIAKKLNPTLDRKRVNLKLIADSERKYSTFGNFPDYVEEYVEGAEPKLKYSPYEVTQGLNGTAQKATSEVDEKLKQLLG